MLLHDPLAQHSVIGRHSGLRPQLSVASTQRAVSAGEVVDVTFHDINLRFTYSADGVVYDRSISLENPLADGTEGYLVVPQVTPVSGANLTFVRREPFYVDVWSRLGGTQHYEFLMQSDVQYTVEALNYSTPGTLAKHVWDGMLALTDGLTASDAIQRWYFSSNYDVDNLSLDLNESLFVNSLDISGIALFAHGGAVVEPALVSQRHALLARHVTGNAGPGARFLFLDTSGAQVVRTVIALTHVVRGAITPDLSVLYFDAPVSGCTPFKVLPRDWVSYALSLDAEVQVAFGPPDYVGAMPIVRKSAHKTDMTNGETFQINFIGSVLPTQVHNIYLYPTDTIHAPFTAWGNTGGAIGGDSGGPSFLLIGGELVLLCSQYTVTSAAAISEFSEEIEEIMNAQASVAGDTLSGTYSLERVDLSAFTRFG